MYATPANNNALAGEREGSGDSCDSGGVETTIKSNTQVMDQMQQQQQQQQLEQQNINYNGMQSQQQQQPTNSSKNVRKKPYVKITEQPAGKALRFRYECEGRSAGSIPGVNSTPENKTYPTIEIVGYKGRAVVVVSCVTKDQPYRPHPHNLVGKEGCKKGVCTLEINSETMRAVFSNLGIQCVKKKDIEGALKAREEIRVDPFKTGFAHRFQPSSIDLNSVRLCFQVFMESDQKGRFTQPLPPVVSEPIYDKKAMSDLVICRLCSCSATVLGNTQIILLCEKVAKEDISVRFYEENNGQTIWEAFGEFQHTDVHKQTAIAFKTPRYRKTDITEPAKVFIQLKRPSDGVTSEALPFEYVPLDSGRKRFLDLRRVLKRKPDLDILQENLCTEIKDSEQVTNENTEVIDLNTPTFEELPESQSHQYQGETVLTSTNIETMNSDDEEAKRRSQHEIDLIIDEKMRELEQQQQQQAAQVPGASMQEVVEVLTAEHHNENDQQNQLTVMDTNEKITEWMNSNELLELENPTINESIETNSSTNTETTQVATNDSDEQTLNDLLEQVAELDGIYSDHVIRRDTYNSTLINELNVIDSCVPEADTTMVDGGQTAMEVEESFDDAATYSSLQIAFKNPISIPISEIMPLIPPTSHLEPDFETDHYDPIEVQSSPMLTSLPPAPIVSKQKPDILSHSQSQPQLQAPPRPAPPQINSLHMHVTAAEEEKLPPLPPKRLRKQDSNAENRSIEANIGSTLDRKSRQQTPIIIMKTPDQSPPTKRLPQKPGSCNTLPKQKKPGFFSKLFSRRKSKSDISQAGDQITGLKAGSKAYSPTVSREPSIGHFNVNDSNRASMHSVKSLQTTSLPNSPEKRVQKVGKPVGRSVSSVSGKRPSHLNANVIHIPLKGESYNSLPQNEEYSHASTLTLSNTLDRKTVSALQLADIPICDGNMELVAIADRQSLRNLCGGEFNVQLDPNVDLTEAEHFALYTSIPPQATVSEFDETSAYYAPVDADPAHLKRKRQKTNGDPVHLLLQQQRNQHQNDHQDGRQATNINCWNTTNITAIKTEPRDTSPQPYSVYRGPPELTPSPQPLSPSNVYTHNTPSPYNMATTVTTGIQGSQQLISPNQLYKYNAANRGGSNNNNPIAPPPMDISDYNAFSQQTQQQQQQFHGNNYGGAGATHWEAKFNPASAAGNNLSNLNNTNTFTMHNLLTPSNGAGGLGNGSNGTGTSWNLNSNHFLPHPHHLQQQYQQHQTTNDGVATSNNGVLANAAVTSSSANNANNNEHGLSNLLNFDSEQLVRINSEDQQMLRLNSEDLQISNLSIST